MSAFVVTVGIIVGIVGTGLGAFLASAVTVDK